MEFKMTIEEIRKGAPDGANYYWMSYKTWKVYYFKVNGSKVLMWNALKEWFSESSLSVCLKPL